MIAEKASQRAAFNWFVMYSGVCKTYEQFAHQQAQLGLDSTNDAAAKQEL